MKNKILSKVDALVFDKNKLIESEKDENKVTTLEEHVSQHEFILNNGFTLTKYQDAKIFKKHNGKYLIKIKYIGELTPSLAYYRISIHFKDDGLRLKLSISDCKTIDEEVLMKIRGYISLLSLGY